MCGLVRGYRDTVWRLAYTEDAAYTDLRPWFLRSASVVSAFSVHGFCVRFCVRDFCVHRPWFLRSLLRPWFLRSASVVSAFASASVVSAFASASVVSAFAGFVILSSQLGMLGRACLSGWVGWLGWVRLGSVGGCRMVGGWSRVGCKLPCAPHLVP